MKTGHVISSCLVGTVLGTVVVADRFQQASPPQPSFRSSVNLVIVDMRVAAGANQIADLRAGEITLLVDGAPRRIVSLDYYPSTAELQATNSSSRTPVRDAPTNPGAGAGIRRVVVLVDRDSIESGKARSVEKNARAFIERLPPSFAVAVTLLPLRNGIRFEPKRADAQRALKEAFAGTTRRGSGLEGLSGFGCSGSAASSGCGDQGLDPRINTQKAKDINLAAELRVRGGAILDDLLWLFRSLEDGPSDVVLVSGGFPDERRLQPQIDKVLAAARAANVHVHAIHVADRTQVPLREGGEGPEAAAAPLPTIAARTPDPRRRSYGLPEETGGLEEDGSVTGEGFFKRLSGELTGAYVLAFEPLPSERDGKPHRLEIRLPHRGRATIHARKVFVLPTPAAPSANREETRSTSVPRLPPVTVTPPIVETPALTAPVGAGGDNALLRSLVERATGYVEDVQRLLPSIVVEEQYVQVITRWSGEALKVAAAAPESPRDESGLSSRGVLRRRQLLSDVLLIQLSGKAWVGYRDVAEVDGKPIRDRAVRLQKLFVSGSAGDRRQMQRIADESARLNLGPRRNINTPTFPLWILTAQNVGRFAWALERLAPGAPCCAVVDFREVTKPTIVSTDEKRDIPLSGRFWIEPGTGRVRQALLTFAERREHVNGWFTVHYGPLPDFDVLVPVSMGEWSTTPDPDASGQSAFIAGRATYSNVRRFTVHAEETMK